MILIDKNKVMVMVGVIKNDNASYGFD